MVTYNGVPMRTMVLPKSKYAIKAPYSMVPKGATAHNTYNDATAESEIKYMQSNNNYVSYHAAIDDKEVIFGVPFDRSTWHAGDGINGYGNRNHISFEICYSKSGGAKYKKAEENAVKVLAYALYTRKWGISKLKKHQDWSGKNCPHRILDEKRWDELKNKVAKELDRLNGDIVEQASKPKPTPAPSKPTVSKPSTNKTSSIVDYLNGLKINSSPANRKKLAIEYGVKNYDLTAAKNTELLNKMRAGKPVSKPAAKPKPVAKKNTVTLPKSAKTWRTYKTNVQPVKANSDWSLTPSAFGGITYEILGRPQANVVTVNTSRGKRNIFVGPGTGAVIK